jgi:hypothetical protein
VTGEPAAAVHVHVHHAMTGAFPLRVGDLLFADRQVVVPEYEYLTPLFGIARGSGGDAAEAARDRYESAGIEGLLAMAEQVHRVSYADLEAVDLYDPPRPGRPKVALSVAGTVPYAYRIHAPVDLDALAAALESLGDRRGVAVRRSASLGFSPRNSLRRFLADR